MKTLKVFTTSNVLTKTKKISAEMSLLLRMNKFLYTFNEISPHVFHTIPSRYCHRKISTFII